MPKLEPFAGDGGEDWNEYVEILEQYFIANQVEEARRRAVFLSHCGRATYSLLRRLLAPRKPSEVPLGECLAVLTDHYAPRPSVIVQRYLFYSRGQHEVSSIWAMSLMHRVFIQHLGRLKLSSGLLSQRA